MGDTFRRRELCNLNDPQEGELCLQIAGESLTNSEWTLIGGKPSANYMDLDNFLCHQENVKKFLELLTQKIKWLSGFLSFEKIALIDKAGPGPVGLITMFGALSMSLEKDLMIVRPRKQLLQAATKGLFNRDDRVLLLSDVATEGWTIFQAAESIRSCGAKVPYALVVYDRGEGATVNLGRKGIELFSLFSSITLKNLKASDLESRYGKVIQVPTPQLIDFGGVALTVAG